MQRIEWLGMAIDAAEDWEVLRHSTRRERGRLMLADSVCGRMTLAWAVCRNRPDSERLMQDYRSRDLEQDPDATFEPLEELGAWEGYRWQRGSDELPEGSEADADAELEPETAPVTVSLVTRAGLYEPVYKRWVEATLYWPGAMEMADRQLERRILGSFEVIEPEQGLGRVRAFGVSVTSPKSHEDGGWELEKVEARLGQVTLEFQGRGRQRATVRKLGATAAWFDGDAEAFLRRQMGSVRYDIEAVRYDGQNAWLARSRPRGEGYRWLLRPDRRQDLVWANPRVEHLYHVTTLGPNCSALEAAQFEVRATSRGGMR
ncbi:MAG: hypothetical protein IT441_04680 [Phycisphaeraceae bacterium]|nr:hypothetical protein [Phycisphaeraceae bacterium]